jgi:hypothetical protein
MIGKLSDDNKVAVDYLNTFDRKQERVADFLDSIEGT